MEKSTDSVYKIVNDRISALLERGIIPWRQPWRGGDVPRNFVTRKAYRGVNIFILNTTAILEGYSCNQWMTFNQAKKLGAHVRRGEHPTPCVFYKFLERENKETGEKTTFPLLLYFNVFNLDQIDDLKQPITPLDTRFTPIEKAEKITALYTDAPRITHSGDAAFYSPSTDSIKLPPPDDFESPESYYRVKFHELAHSTGHPTRLGRFDLDHSLAPFGNPDYSKEELVAESTAAFLCGVCGIDNQFEQSAAYIQNWLSVLQNDKYFLIRAMTAAQKAADWIQGRKATDSDDSQAE